jgi:thiol-disulfide isomerase/thioredoxin
MSQRMKTAWIVAAAALAAGACKKHQAAPAPVPGAGSAAAAGSAAGAADPCAGGEARGALTWHEDDYDQALACAKQRGVPLVVDMWAPWCHTCLSMSQYVLTDPSLAPVAARFVWLGIDTDRETNAKVVAKLPMQAWPSYFVLAPDDGAIEARFVGAATLAQFRAFLHQGEAGVLEARAGGLPPDSPLRHVRDGDRATAAGDLAAADAAYGAALAAAPADWARRPDVLVAQIGTRYKAKDYAACVDLGLAGMDQTGRAASVTDFLVWALYCADEETKARAEPARVAELRRRAAARLRQIVDDAGAPLSVDDRSDAMANLREVLDTLGKKAEARAVAERQARLLDDAAARAPTPMAAMTYNWPRAEVYVYLGRPMDLVPALEKSAADLPDQYDPAYRLAWVLSKAGKLDDAQIWADQAAARAYGKRRVHMMELSADIAGQRGDAKAERDGWTKVVDAYAELPKGQAPADDVAAAKAKLAALVEGTAKK